jgi:hypothetical protein
VSEYDGLIEDEDRLAAEHAGETLERARKGPQQRPGPNDESLPALMTAADLLPEEDDPLASLPQEPPDDDTPPDDVVPAFLVQRNKFGPGSHGVYLPDGRPVGIWLSEEYPGLEGERVTQMLTELGMEEDLAGWYGKIRSSALEADQRLRRDPGVRQAMAQEAERLSAKQGVQKAFLDAHKRAKRDG